MAKAIYNAAKTDDTEAFAYGTNVAQQDRVGLKLSDYPPIADAILVLKNHGMDISNECCMQLLPEHLEGASRIIVMTEKEDMPEWLQKYAYDYWEIPNPQIVTKETAEEIYLLLKDKIQSLI